MTRSIFLLAVNHKRIAKDYSKAVQSLDSADSKIQVAGIQTLAATEELGAIPWIAHSRTG
jgi:hypothetical protein